MMLCDTNTLYRRTICLLLVIYFPIVSAAGLSTCLPSAVGQEHSNIPASGESRIKAEAMHHHDPSAPLPKAGMDTAVGIDEKLGQKIPLALTFKDEENQALSLAGYIQKPTLILPVFFTCPQTCSLMLANLAQALNQVPLTPGLEYRVLAFSFDDEDTPSAARFSKSNYIKLLSNDFPAADWKFLTGDLMSITSFTQSAGYRFKKTGKHSFTHPNVLIVTASDGKIIRYLYGPDFQPFDIGMALTEATKGTPQISIRKILTYCFQYDPQSRGYVLKTFRFFAAGVVVLLMLFLVFLLRKGNRKT